jgi:transposase
VWDVLERSDAKLELLLINPQHVHALRGRKTDQKDCERIAELLQFGLLKAVSFHHRRFGNCAT